MTIEITFEQITTDMTDRERIALIKHLLGTIDTPGTIDFVRSLINDPAYDD